MKFGPFKLTPRWVLPQDTLKGWVVIHGDITKQIEGVEHLSHVKIKCIETGKTVFCRIYGPGASQSSIYSKFHGANKIKKAICMDAYFQKKFNIPYLDVRGAGQDDGTKEYNFIIFPVGFFGKMQASLAHPEDGIRIGMQIAMISLSVGFISLMVGFLSLCVGIISLIVSVISKAL